MSDTLTKLDAKQHVIDYIKQVTHLYLIDLSYIPSDKLATVPLGVARTPLEFTAECAGFNEMVTKIIRGEDIQRKTEEERKVFYESLNTYEKAKTALENSVTKVISIVEDLSEDDLAKEVTAPWGEVVTIYKLANMTAGHIFYHDGQLNYIQSLYGDDKVHWME